MSDYSVEDHIAYNMGFKAGQETQAARIAELEAALWRIVGTLDDPTGGQHVSDMRTASVIAIAALKGGKMSDTAKIEIKPHHLRGIASDIEDCHDPQSWADYCRAAAAMLEIKDARIAELEAALATARRDGMEEAAKIAENHSDLKGADLLKRFSQVTVARGTNIFTKREIAAAIRAAAEEVKP